MDFFDLLVTSLIMLCLAAFFAASSASAMDAPSPDAALAANFGLDNGGAPMLGDSFDGEGAVRAVRAAETGSLLFSSGRNAVGASRLPTPLGAWMAVDHGDGLVSLYSRLDGARAPTNPDTVQKGMVIGRAGTSGWSEQTGFYFSLFDRKERRWINPSMIAVRRSDTTAPVIQAVRLMNDRDRLIDPAQTRTLTQGRYTVFVTASDTDTPDGAPLAPFRIMGSLNGAEVGVIALETLSARDGVFWIYRNGLVPVRQVYAQSPAFELGEAVFTRGQATLEIVVQDANENVQSAVYTFTVE